MAQDSLFGRRKYPRVRTEVLFSVTRKDAPDGLAYAVDFSLGGIRFQCVGLEFKVGQLLHVRLNLGGTEVSAIGKLVRITQPDGLTPELALAFVEVEARTLKLLEEYLEDAEEL